MDAAAPLEDNAALQQAKQMGEIDGAPAAAGTETAASLPSWLALAAPRWLSRCGRQSGEESAATASARSGRGTAVIWAPAAARPTAVSAGTGTYGKPCVGVRSRGW